MKLKQGTSTHYRMGKYFPSFKVPFGVEPDGCVPKSYRFGCVVPCSVWGGQGVQVFEALYEGIGMHTGAGYYYLLSVMYGVFLG